MCFVSSITTSILCWQDCARTRTMYYCRTESPRPATWIPIVGSTALAVSRVTVVPKVKSAPWHQVRLAHVLKVQWNLLNLINFAHSSMFFYLFKLFSPWAIFSISFLFDSCFALLDLVLSAIHWGHYTPTAPSQCKLSPYTWLCLMMNQTHLVQIYHQEILDYSLSLSALLIQKHWVKIMKTSSALWWCFENMQFLRFTKFLLEKIQKNPLNSS